MRTSFFVLLVATTFVFTVMSGNQIGVEGLPLVRQVRDVSDDYEDVLAGNDFLSVLLKSSMHRLKKETTPLSETETEPPPTTELNPSMVIEVHVSSSSIHKIEDVIAKPAIAVDQNLLQSEDRPNIVANVARSELTIDEPEPITKDSEDVKSDISVDLNGLQATIQNLPSSQQISYNPAVFRRGDISDDSNEGNVPPFHHSLIYHDGPHHQPGRARSVSYSTIIQNIQQANKPDIHERKERNYPTGTIYANSFNNPDDRKPSGTTSTTTTTTTTTSTISTTTTVEPSKIYGRPEQNYEVDEAVSVETNGRTHGIQKHQFGATQKPPSMTTATAIGPNNNKDQKVGYVVQDQQGHKFKQYRVEERTADGFIVGEYGMVSPDDGSLRGVRYTADGTINPRLIYDALKKFLAL